MKKTLLTIIAFVLMATTANSLGIVRLGVEYFPDKDRSRAITNGYIYVGNPGTDPTIVANQKQLNVQQEGGAVVQVAQPLRTNSGGVPEYLGSPVTMLVSGDYSLLVQNSSQAQEYYISSTLGGVTEVKVSLNEKYGCDLSEALTEIGSVTQTTLDIDCACILDDGETLTSTDNITLRLPQGGSIDGVSGGGTETLVINGYLEAGGYEIFGSSLSLSFSDEFEGFFKAAWFGFLPGNSEADNDSALATMSAGIPSGATIQFGAGEYNITKFTWPQKRWIWEGKTAIESTTANPGTMITGSGTPVISFTSAGVNTSRNSIIRQMRIQAAPANLGLLIENLGVNLEDVFVFGGGFGIECNHATGSMWNRVWAYGTTNAFLFNPTGTDAVTQCTFNQLNGACNNTTGTVMKLSGSVTGNIVSNTFVNGALQNGDVGLQVDNNPKNNTFINYWTESINTTSLTDGNTANSTFINFETRDGGVAETFGLASGVISGGNTTLSDLSVDNNTLKFDAVNNRVAIGDPTAVQAQLHVSGSYTGGTPSPNADELLLESTGGTGMTILSGSGSTSSIFMGDSSDTDKHGLTIDNFASQFSLKLNNTNVFTATSDGNFSLNGNQWGSNAQGVLALQNVNAAPTGSQANGVQLYAEDVAASSEFKVRNELGTVTQLSSHRQDYPDDLEVCAEFPWVKTDENEYIGVRRFVAFGRLAELVQALAHKEGFLDLDKKIIAYEDIAKRDFIEDKKEHIRQVLKEELITTEEVPLSEAFEDGLIEVTDKRITTEYIEYKLVNGEVIPVTKKRPKVENKPGKILKPGLEFDKTTGRIFKQVHPSEKEIEEQIKKIKIDAPKWIVGRMAK